jgi:hypothetical protein
LLTLIPQFQANPNKQHNLDLQYLSKKLVKSSKPSFLFVDNGLNQRCPTHSPLATNLISLRSVQILFIEMICSFANHLHIAISVSGK